MIPWWWLVVAFALGVLAEFKFGMGLLRWVLRDQPKLFEHSLRKLDYDRLKRLRNSISREIMRREPS